MPHSKKILKKRKSLTLVVIVVAVCLIGIGAILISRAASAFIQAEPESGVLSTPAIKITDTTASNSSAVTFKNPTPPPAGTTLTANNFDSFKPAAPMLIADYRTAMGDPTTAAQSTMANTSIVAVSGRGNVIRQTLPATLIGGGSGITAMPHLNKDVDDASIQYDIRFASDFDWSWGGKLPGLGGALPGVGPGIASGCNAPTGNAWSGRGMWITPGSYGSVTGTNEWIGYMYNYNKVDACGDNIRTAKAFSKGTWHTVKQHYKMNTIAASGTPNADGIHQMWLDGVLIKSNTTFKYRNSTSLHINYIFWHIFRGGNTADWGSPTPGIIDIDNLVVTTP